MNVSLIDHLSHLIASTPNNHISFAEYMDTVLYHPINGYYNTRAFDLRSKNRDFVTAPTLSPLFADCLANQCLSLASYLDSDFNILEIGAGCGQLAYDLLQRFNELTTVPQQYAIYEKSKALQDKQKNMNSQLCSQLQSRVEWLQTLPQHFTGIVIANEVLDALPVHCFQLSSTEAFERCVTINQNASTPHLMWQLKPLTTNNELDCNVNQLRNHLHLMPPYASEINLQANLLLAALANSMQKGIILFFDYGYGEREYYHPERNNGTMATIHEGRRLNDPLQFPGEQDITAHVDFTRIAQLAVDHGFEVAGYTTQAAFLFGNGLIDIAENKAKSLTPQACFELQQAIKYLTWPTEMGERIKVMALTKNMDCRKGLVGFHFKDNRREL